MKPGAKGNGILGKKVELVTGDTQTKSDAACFGQAEDRERWRDHVLRWFFIWCGCCCSGTGSGNGTVFMAGLTHSNDTTGKDRRRYGFRHFFNAHMSGAALAPVLQAEYGNERQVYHLTADYNWGWSQESSIQEATAKQAKWNTVNAVRTPLGAGDFSQYITPVLNSGADTLVLNHYGKDMETRLPRRFSLSPRQASKRVKTTVVVPLFSRLMAQGAGDNRNSGLNSMELEPPRCRLKPC